MNKQISLICFLVCIFFACKIDPKEQGTDTNESTSTVTEKTAKPKLDQKTFGETTEAFLESIGADEEVKAEYLQKLKELESMPGDSSEMVQLLETLMAEAIQREQGEDNLTHKRQSRQSGNMDDLTAAFEKLNAESGVEATIGKLKKVDSITGQDSFQVLDMDQETIDQLSEKAKSAVNATYKKTAQKDKMTDDEMDMMRSFTRAHSNLHNTAELDKLHQMIAGTDLDKMAAENKITERYAQMQGNEFDRIMKRLATKKQEVTKAQLTFKKLNPDLYFGEEAGFTYFGNRGKAVYLPLGKLSFADKVVTVDHPENKKTATFSLGEPDAYTTGMNSVMNVHSMGLKGQLVVKFEDNALVDVNGPDLYIFELGQIEPTNLDISKDGKTWIAVGKISGGVAEVDIHDFVKRDELYYYVRLTDLETSSGIPGADVDAIAAIGSAVRLNLDSQVLFDTGKSVLKSAGKEALKELVKSLKILERGNVIVEGHTDDVGSTTSNKQLSLARAKSVSSELKKLLPSQKFKWKEQGYGEEKPLFDNDSDENRAKNRRVEVLVLPN
ncbi:OmpA family protein [Maribacter sp. CXY002]|uniref:OmpA family protein n=1 Tax=Maribacter luteocoastalis TaxID=3407671 RepID=UPI003B685A68